MISIDKTFSGVVIVAPIILGAFLSGILYLLEGFSIPLTIFQLTLVCGFIFFGLKKIITRDISLEIYGLEIEYILFLTIIFLSLIYSPDRGEGLFYSVRYITLLAMTYLIYNSINTISEFRIIIVVVVFSALLVALKSIFDTYSNPEIIAFNYINAGRKLMRSAGDETDPNRFAISFAMPFMLLLNLVIVLKDKKLKTVLFGFLMLVIIAVLITYSRSTWVAFFFASAVAFKYHKKYSIILYVFIFSLLILIVSESAQTILVSIIQRVKDIFAGSSDDSSNIRIMLFIGGMKMFFDSYMVGIGFHGFSTRFQEYFPTQETVGVYEAHNEYYRILAELGLVGFVVFIYILAKVVKVAITTIKASSGIENTIATSLFCSLIAYFIFFMFYADMLYNSLFFINIVLIFTLNKIVNASKNMQLQVGKATN
ncbi:O-antigen ligase family protein [Gelidibacter japonicus]|uniref:O-antigen ligase family protein n=1 Tax=Gelidibacter japonicus TaxID=1962232 RepID=UPI003A8D14F4